MSISYQLHIAMQLENESGKSCELAYKMRYFHIFSFKQTVVWFWESVMHMTEISFFLTALWLKYPVHVNQDHLICIKHSKWLLLSDITSFKNIWFGFNGFTKWYVKTEKLPTPIPSLAYTHSLHVVSQHKHSYIEWYGRGQVGSFLSRQQWQGGHCWNFQEKQSGCGWGGQSYWLKIKPLTGYRMSQEL